MERITHEQVEPYILKVIQDIQTLLVEKNISYNASIFNRGRFGPQDPSERLWCRIEDKLNRLEARNSYPGDNDIRDLAGYFIALLAISERQKDIGKDT